MHLGMSGSFRVGKDGEEATPGDFQYERSKAAAHDHVVFHMSSGATRDLQRSAPLRLHEARAARRSSIRSRCCVRSGRSRSAMNSARLCWRAPAAARRQSLKAALSDQRVVAGLGNIYVCEALQPRASVAQAPRFDHRREKRRAERTRGRARRCDQGGAQRRDQGRRLVACAIIAAPTASSAISSIRSASMTAKARNVRRAAARARSGGSCRPAARRFSVRSARNETLKRLFACHCACGRRRPRSAASVCSARLWYSSCSCSRSSVRHVLGGGESVFRAAARENQRVELDLQRGGVAVLRVLNQEHHQERDDGGRCIDDELPGVAEAEERPADRPDDDRREREQECGWTAGEMRT